MDPRTGRDPRDGERADLRREPTSRPRRADERRNRAVTDLYEPGSTFKIVTIAGALEDNVVTPETSFTLAPTIQVADRVIHESHIRGTERMTVRQILAESSNVGTITIAKDRLGGPELARWISRFGFGKTSGSDLPGESPRHGASVRPVVGLDDRQRADRPGHRGHAAPDGERVRGDRQRRRDADAPRDREGRREEGAPRGGPPGRLEVHGRPHDGDVPRRRRRGDRHRGRDPRLHGGREDGHREQGRERHGTSRSTSRRSSGSSRRASRGSRSS